ncbi:hypothetical protein GCM10020001_007110 [Nonomuraea salmonea]
MKVDLISEHADPLAAVGGVDSGGQNVYVAALAVALAERGHTVAVHTRRSSEEQPESVRLAPGVTVEYVTAGPAAPRAEGRAAPRTCRSSPNDWPSAGRRARRTSCTRTSG